MRRLAPSRCIDQLYLRVREEVIAVLLVTLETAVVRQLRQATGTNEASHAWDFVYNKVLNFR